MRDGVFYRAAKGGNHYFARFLPEQRVVVAVVATRDPFEKMIRNVLAWLDGSREETTSYETDGTQISFVVDYGALFAGGRRIEYRGTVVDEETVILNSQPHHRLAWPEPIDLNAADLETLEWLPGINTARGTELLTSRAVNGPFSALDDLRQIHGFGPELLEQLAPWVVIG